MGSRIKTIMIFDDSTLIRTSLAFYLNKMGFRIIEADSSRNALEKIIENEIDLFIIDIDMPDTERVSFFDAVNSNEYSRHIPVIMISSEHNFNIIENFNSNGEKSWKINSFDPLKLFTTIKDLMVI